MHSSASAELCASHAQHSTPHPLRPPPPLPYRPSLQATADAGADAAAATAGFSDAYLAALPPRVAGGLLQLVDDDEASEEGEEQAQF